MNKISDRGRNISSEYFSHWICYRNSLSKGPLMFIYYIALLPETNANLIFPFILSSVWQVLAASSPTSTPSTSWYFWCIGRWETMDTAMSNMVLPGRSTARECLIRLYHTCTSHRYGDGVLYVLRVISSFVEPTTTCRLPCTLSTLTLGEWAWFPQCCYLHLFCTSMITWNDWKQTSNTAYCMLVG